MKLLHLTISLERKPLTFDQELLIYWLDMLVILLYAAHKCLHYSHWRSVPLMSMLMSALQPAWK